MALSPGGTGGWVNLATDPTPLANLRFGDFDGDNRTDVFSQLPSAAAPVALLVRRAAWQNLLIDPTPLHDLRFGDFDRDWPYRRLQRFAIGGTYQWRYSSGGVAELAEPGPRTRRAGGSALRRLQRRPLDRRLQYLRRAVPLFPSGTGGWIYLSPTPSPTVTPPWSPVSDLRFGDFDGDNRTDVFRAYGSQWQFSSGGLGSWQNLATDSLPLTDLRFSDPMETPGITSRQNPMPTGAPTFSA